MIVVMWRKTGLRRGWSISLARSPVLALVLTLSLGTIPGLSAESLVLSLETHRGISLFMVKCLFPHPVLLLSKSSSFPFLEGFWGFHINTSISKCSLTLLVLAQGCSLGWSHCTNICNHSGHGCRCVYKVIGSLEASKLCEDTWFGWIVGLWSLVLPWGSVILVVLCC